MPHPLLLEINTRCWLAALAARAGRAVTLASVPEKEINAWKKGGFSHIWLMGVWAAGPKTLEFARVQPSLQALSANAFGINAEEKLVSSPYAVADFTVAETWGGADGLREFRSRLHRHGLGLVLDFIPNHLGLDHPWLTERTELFVRSGTPRAETFAVTHEGLTYWVAHGKDPYFSAWTDTAQLDYRLAATRTAMTEALVSVAAQCDGVRCDMAMLVLNDIFTKTWAEFPGEGPAPSEEFWQTAISAVKGLHPEFLFIAEAYWDLEARLGALGFDYVYDKKFLDYLKGRDYDALQKHIRTVAGKFKPVRFLENHDEARIASIFSAPEQKALAVLLLTQPGLRLIYDGQMSGSERHTPVQFASYWPEPENPETDAFYKRLLALLPRTSVGCGEPEFLDAGLPHCFVTKWNSKDELPHLATVNLSPRRANFEIHESEAGGEWANVFSDADSSWICRDEELHIDLAPWGFALLELRRT